MDIQKQCEEILTKVQNATLILYELQENIVRNQMQVSDIKVQIDQLRGGLGALRAHMELDKMPTKEQPEGIECRPVASDENGGTDPKTSPAVSQERES